MLAIGRENREFIDYETTGTIDVHGSINQTHDSEIGWQVLTRNLDQLETVTSDKGYGWGGLRSNLRVHNTS